MWYKISKKDLKLGEKFIFYFYCLCIISLFFQNGLHDFVSVSYVFLKQYC